MLNLTTTATARRAPALRAPRRTRGLLTAFAATAATHLGSLLTEAKVVEQVTKPALMPLLATHAVSSAAPDRAPRLLTPALLASAAGDALLQVDSEPAFLAGMGAFAAAHICYVTMFAKQGALTDRRRTALVAAGYALAWAVMISQLWPGLGELKAPVAGYSLLLAATAVASAGLGRRGGLGGALFLLSDTLIATRLAGWRELPGHEFWIMSTYLLAQYLLATAALKSAQG
ncbi:lysoplasmalogenase [Kitasatospora sp. NBC_01250]|uniref:lysoplasmalogenase n=1 Tax=Kitasatospora sp. NBC_01250 TaxID=2903571 RepID=UPI002E343B4D|nr:lysoplasmalogenase [Kitasatospora sp. NBC_01250]